MPEDELTLNPIEVRVLGSLVEKELTTPDYYPLSLNALVNACNQTSNRDPVMSIEETVVVRALDRLREERLAFQFGGAQARVPRYGHKLAESFELPRPEVAALCVLFLRGPQTVGEVRGRSGRMHEFATLEAAAAVLAGLAVRTPKPLVALLPRQTGFKEPRYAHLLGGAPALSSLAAPASAPEGATLIVRAENERIDRLEAEIAELKRQFAEFRKQFE